MKEKIREAGSDALVSYCVWKEMSRVEKALIN